MLKLTFMLVTGKNDQIFSNLVNYQLEQGWKFMTGQPVLLDRKGNYSIAMLLEEETE